jgi:hypothetical protein
MSSPRHYDPEVVTVACASGPIVFQFVNVSRAAAARITTGVSHCLRLFDGSGPKEGSPVDDIANSPNNAAILRSA